jgi:hypothetical protein
MAVLTTVKNKYDTERNKCFKALSDGQGERLKFRDTSLLEKLDRDPWVDYDNLAKQPSPLQDGSDIRFLILGAGHCSILFAYHLIAAGFQPSEIVVIDEAGGFGGT